MQSRQHQMTRERRPYPQGGGFPVANLPYHEHIGILAQHPAQQSAEGEPDILVHLNLIDAGNDVLHRVFQGDDFLPLILDLR